MRDPSLIATLRRLTSDGGTCFGSAVERIDPLRLIPRAFSTVLRARVITRRGEVVVYCKTFHSPAGDPTSFERLRFRVEREFRETARAYQSFAGKPGFDPVEAIAVYPDLLALVTREVTAEPFSALLSCTSRPWSSAGVVEALRAAMLAGEWLRTYQRLPAAPERISVDDLRAYVDTRLQRLIRERAGGFSQANREAILSQFDDACAQAAAEDFDAVPVHADFCPDNILVRQGTISVIDFAMAKPGLRYLDLSHLLMHLDFRRGPSWSQKSLAAIRDSLVTGYGDPDVARRAAFRVAVLVHVSAMMADRLNRASRLRAAKRVWLRPQIRRCLEFVHA